MTPARCGPFADSGAYAGKRLFAFAPMPEGTLLRDRGGQGAMSEKEAIALAKPLLAGLAQAHQFGVTHQAIDARPAVQRGLQVLSDKRRKKPGFDDKEREILFGKTQYKRT